MSAVFPSSQMAAVAWLVPLSGPALEPLEIRAKPGGVVVGRHEASDVRLPADADKVSRHHARFMADVADDGGTTWRIADLKSRWGTYLNGVRIAPGRDVPVREGDLVRIVPWTFSFSAVGTPRKGLLSNDDSETAHTLVRTMAHDHVRGLEDDLLSLLLESTAAIHAAESEPALAALLVDAAVRGSGLPNAAVLRPLDNAGRIEVVASKTVALARDGAGPPPVVFSRSLLATAAQGVVAELSAASGVQQNVSQSIVEMQIDAALCVPLMLGNTVASFLYLDSRGGSPLLPKTLRPNASAFCLALGRMAGLALSNLKRIDVERRAATIEAELAAAAAAQKWIMPKRRSALGPFTVTGDSRAGEYLGGDFFDVIPLADGRLAVALGDVSGHGIAASVLMTASQGFLHAALKDHGDPARAATELSRFVNPRRPENKFLTLWVGVFDPAGRTVTYVDAGHGYAQLAHADGRFEGLNHAGGPPVGILDDYEYVSTVAPLPEGSRALVVSDGIIEQSRTDAPPGTPRRQFEVAGVQAALAAAPGDDAVEQLFQAVYAFAATTSLADDATVVLVRW